MTYQDILRAKANKLSEILKLLEELEAAQADWNESDPTSINFIRNKPVVPELDGIDSFIVLTQAEYNALTNPDATTLYIVTD